jgi:hypothetical protein
MVKKTKQKKQKNKQTFDSKLYLRTLVLLETIPSSVQLNVT